MFMRPKEFDAEITDILMERPRCFTVGSRQFCLYPVTLGKSYLLARLIKSLDIDERMLKINYSAEALRLIHQKPDIVYRLIAYHTINTKTDLFNENLVRRRMDYFRRHLTDEDAAELMIAVLTPVDVRDVERKLGITAERERYEKTVRQKKYGKNNLVFGAVTMMGALILPACEKLNMTPHEVMWEISYPMLQLLMADAIMQVYMTDEELKRNNVSTDREIIKADDPANLARIKAMKWD